jgi:hypothetical protein
MEIKIFSDIPHVQKSLEVVEEILPSLNSRGYYFYYPFNQSDSEDAILKQIRVDQKEKKYDKKVESFLKKWVKIERKILGELDKFIFDQKNDTVQELCCVLTMYGPYGYFYTPETIYVNLEQDKDIDFYVEVMLHESLHLILEKDAVYLNKSYIDKERIVDQTFVSLFGRYFPNYKVQNI